MIVHTWGEYWAVYWLTILAVLVVGGCILWALGILCEEVHRLFSARKRREPRRYWFGS